MKNKNNLLKFTNIVLFITMIAIILVSGTYAKYTSTASGTSATVVANWSFNVNDKNIAAENTFEFNLFDTANIKDSDGNAENDVAEGLIAPGTSGAFEFALENTSDVTAKYEIKLDVTNTNNIPLEFSFTGEENSWTTDLTDLVATDAMAIGSSKNVTVQWRWPFGDTTVTDATLGGKTVTVKATITATQLDNSDVVADDEPEVNVLEGKSALFIGDSVQYGQGNSGKAWSYYIDQEYSMGDVTNVAVSGSSYTKNSTGTDRIINQFKNLTGSYDYVILEGGINDLTYGSEWGTLSDTYSITNNSQVVVEAMEEAFYTALTKFPNAKFGYILLYNTEDSGRSGHDTELPEYHDLIVSICQKWNIPVFDMYSGSVVHNGQTVTFDELLDVHNKTYLADGLHLNEAGYLLTYEYIAEWMQTLTTVSVPEIEENEEPTVETVTLGSNTYTAVNSIADLQWTTGYQLSQDGLIYNAATGKSGRLASKGYVLKVSGGETISISDGENYNFAIYEVSASNTLTGSKADAWISDSITLNSNTRYVGIYLKTTNEADWTTDQINNIPNILTIE